MNISIEDIDTVKLDKFIINNVNKTFTTKINDKKSKQNGRSKSNRKKREPLMPFHNKSILYEAGIDEAGRGPMFGRVYSACVILPHEGFDHSKMKDSKRFSSKKKILEVYEYIKKNAIDYCVAYEDENVIDDINILQATQQSMHKAIAGLKHRPEHLLVDGNYFRCYNDDKGKVSFTCIEGGDNLYTSIAAASILAKVERDKYIEELCEQYPYLDEYYGLLSNKGYGTKKHMEGIKSHGITQWHRKTFGICKKYA
jgi:ribonuclease HII